MDKIEKLRELADVREIAQDQILKSAISAAHFTRWLWAIFLALLTATVYVTLWMSHIENDVESNTRHVRTLWMSKYGVEP